MCIFFIFFRFSENKIKICILIISLIIKVNFFEYFVIIIRMEIRGVGILVDFFGYEKIFLIFIV